MQTATRKMAAISVRFQTVTESQTKRANESKRKGIIYACEELAGVILSRIGRRHYYGALRSIVEEYGESL